MNIPNTNDMASLKAFAAGIDDTRRLRLAAALLAPSLADAADNSDLEDEDDVTTFSDALNEAGATDMDLDAFMQVVYSVM